jgi:exodeoxyribonuclease VII small subunit
LIGTLTSIGCATAKRPAKPQQQFHPDLNPLPGRRGGRVQNRQLHEALSPILPFIFGLLCLILRLPMSSKTKPPGTELNFEKAMDRLEAIVEQMESGKLPLEDLIVRYEEGMNLVKVCQERLTNAEEKIEIIARNSTGKPTVKNFEPVGELSNDNKADEKELKNDEVRLF